MAQLKDSVVAGSLRVTDTIYGATAQFSAIKIPAASGSNSLGPGSSGSIIMSNATDVYWGTGSDLINALSTGSDPTQANDYLITQYAGGGTTNITYYRRAAKNVRVGGLTTARALAVDLSSVSDGSYKFDGTADKTAIPISNTLGIGHGGTGTSTAPTQYGIIYASTTSAYASTGAGSSGQYLKSNGTSAPTWASFSSSTVGLGNVSNNANLNSTTGAKGDIIYWSAANTPAHLTNTSSTTKKFLSITSQVPSWVTLSNSDVGLGNVENTKLSTWAGSANIQTVGTITSGTWQGSVIAIAKGGTGAGTAAEAKVNLGLGESGHDVAISNYSGITQHWGLSAVVKESNTSGILKAYTGKRTVLILKDNGFYAYNTTDGKGIWQFDINSTNIVAEVYNTPKETNPGTLKKSYKIVHKTNDSTAVGNSTTPIYVTADGAISAGTAIGAAGYKSITNNTTIGALGWTTIDNGTANLPTINTLAFWNGAYSGTSSNLSKLGTVTNGTWQATPISLQYINNWAFVGRNAEITANKNWYKVASCSISDGNQDREMVLHVYDTMVTGAARSGILNVRVRTGSPLTSTTPALNLVWEYNNGFTSEQFKLVSNANTSPCVAELWTNVPYNWIGRVFTVIRMGDRISGQSDTWTLYKNYSTTDNGATGSTSSLTNSVTATYLPLYTGNINGSLVVTGGVTYGIAYKTADGILGIASSLYWENNSYVLLNKNSAGGTATGYYAEGSIHRIGFSIGSSNTSRGIWDANGVGGWTYRLDENSNVEINAGKASNTTSVITFNPNSGSTNYGVQINGYCAVALNVYSGTLSDTVERQAGARSKAGKICVYASGSATGDCGLYWWNNANTGRYIIQTAQDGTARFYGKSDYVRDVTNSGTIDFDYMKSGGYSATPWACMWVNSSNNGNAGMRVGAVSIGNLRNKLLTNGNQADQMWSWGGLTTNSANTAYVNKEFYLVTTTHGLFLWNQSDGNTTWNIPNVIYSSTQPTVVNGAVWLKPV